MPQEQITTTMIYMLYMTYMLYSIWSTECI